ncbi:MAG: hypothetical protein HUJ79_01885 [Firmicutes bacterium]|nr:hypothetical protein [Bacillota bacterium]
MNGNIIGTFIYFWAFMIGVIVFGRVFGLMTDTKTTVIIMIGAAIAFVVWTIGRAKAGQRRQEREAQQQAAKRNNKNRR